MSITTKLNHKQWVKLAYYIDTNGLAALGSSRKMKEFIKETYNGVYDQSTGFGCITFEKEEHLTWFLLNV